MRPNLSRPWLPEEDEALLALARKGMAPRIIASKLRRTLRAVKSRKSQLRIEERTILQTEQRLETALPH